MHLELTMIVNRNEEQTARTVLMSLYQIGMVIPLFDADEEGGGCHIVTNAGNQIHVKEEYEVVCEAIERTKLQMNEQYWASQERERTTSRA